MSAQKKHGVVFYALSNLEKIADRQRQIAEAVTTAMAEVEAMDADALELEAMVAFARAQALRRALQERQQLQKRIVATKEVRS